MKKIKKALSIILITILTLGCAVTSFGAENNAVQIYSEGQLINTQTDVITFGKIIYVSTEYIDKNFNILSNTYNENFVGLSNDFASIEIYYNNGYFIQYNNSNNEEKRIFTGLSAKVYEGKIYVPLAKSLQYLGYSVTSQINYISATKTNTAQNNLPMIEDEILKNKPEMLYPSVVKTTNSSLSTSPECLLNLEFKDGDGYTIPTSGTMYIEIINSLGENVYSGEYGFSPENFTYYKEICKLELRIPVGYTNSTTGILTCSIDLGDDYGFYFERYVDNLPCYKPSYHVKPSHNVLS